jgi:hypothetical protein
MVVASLVLMEWKEVLDMLLFALSCRELRSQNDEAH